ncbi:NmrA family transcriptional regulator [Kocuria polaris]|nr:NmrA family transcriptional regulator [Kocuria polaris]
MTIGVVTPRGNVGAHVLRLLVQSGERPHALLRDPSLLRADLADYVDAAALDVWDEATVVEATRGLDALYWVSPTATDRDPLDAHALAAANVRAAVDANGIKRVVFQSSVGAEKRHGVGEIDGLAAIELELEHTSASVTHLRCGYFFTNLLMDAESIRDGVLATAFDVTRAMPWVAPADIAEVATARLLSRRWNGRHVQAVHGPEDLSFKQVARLLEVTLGHPVTAHQMSDDDVRSALRQHGMPAAQIEAIVMMAAGIREDFTPENPRTYATTTPTTLTSWAAEHLG